MSIKAGAILFDANGYVVDRIQSGGPAALNIPEEKIYEVGNWESVGTVYDIPDLSFDLESFDVAPEFELILVHDDPTSPASATIDFQDAYAIDILSPFKSKRNSYDIVAGVICPYLTLESVSYSFGVGSNASQSFSLRGDSIFYVPGQPLMETATFDGLGGDVVIEYGDSIGPATGVSAAPYDANGTDEFVLNVCLYNNTTGIQKRLYSSDIIANGGSITADTFTLDGTYYNSDTTYEYVQIVYSTTVADTGYIDYLGNDTASVHAAAGANVDATVGGPLLGTQTLTGAGTKPAALRAKDIDVYIADDIAADETLSGTWTRLTGVQNIDVNWSVSLENDEELGNNRYVDQDYDVPEVSGSMTIKAFDVDELFDKIRTVTGITDANYVLGPDVTDPVQLRIVLNDPTDGTAIKTVYLPEARFTVPGFNPQVQTKLESQFDYTSDTGALTVYVGDVVV